MTVTDPVILLRPFVFTKTWLSTTGVELMPYECIDTDAGEISAYNRCKEH